jgi:hypothetical protein
MEVQMNIQVFTGILIPFLGTIAFSLVFVLMMILDVALG